MRSFSSTPPSLKKGGKAARDAAKPSSSNNNSSNDSSSTAADIDPYDLSDLETDLTKIHERLKTDLSKLRTGGRFNHDTLLNLRVTPTKTSSTTIPLSDIAQLIPKGRTLQILVSEEMYTKPVSSAIQASKYSLTPQPDPTGQNACLLVVQIPGPTAESRKSAVMEAGKAGELAGGAVRNARGVQQKKFRAWGLEKRVRPDDLKRAGERMEKVVERAQGGVKRVVDGAKRALDQ